MALGQEPAADLWQAAVSGKFKLTPEQARECASHYEWFAQEMTSRQQEMVALSRLSGFGGFNSAKHLQNGFEGKALQAWDAFRTARESAYRMEAAIYKAANMLEEVDAANASALNAASQGMPHAQT